MITRQLQMRLTDPNCANYYKLANYEQIST